MMLKLTQWLLPTLELMKPHLQMLKLIQVCLLTLLHVVTTLVAENEHLKYENMKFKELLQTLQQENERMKVVHIQLHADNSPLKIQNSELSQQLRNYKHSEQVE